MDQWFVDNIGSPKSSFTYPVKPKLVALTGIGFFDSVHGQKGMPANGREIHPVLSMQLEQEIKVKSRKHKM